MHKTLPTTPWSTAAIFLTLISCGPSTSPDSSWDWLSTRKRGELVTETVVLPGIGAREITYERIDGMAVFEGDIVLPPQLFQTHTSHSLTVPLSANLWELGTINYTIDPSITDPEQINIAIAHWTYRTGLHFKPRTTEPNYVLFMAGNPGSGCTSYGVGRMTGMQRVVLDETTCKNDVIAHEIGHVVGLYHEHSRDDRDQYITINYSNIIPAQRPQFDIKSGRKFFHYDHLSIMHYPGNAFAIDSNIPTITRKDGRVGLGSSTLSSNDIETINYLYWRPFQFKTFLNRIRCLEVYNGNATPGTPVQLWDCNQTPAQDWVLTPAHEFRSGVGNNLCLEIPGGTTAPGTGLQVGQCNGSLAQKWNIYAYAIRSALNPDLCVDVYNGDPSPGIKIQSWACNSTDAQNWEKSQL